MAIGRRIGILMTWAPARRGLLLEAIWHLTRASLALRTRHFRDIAAGFSRRPRQDANKDDPRLDHRCGHAVALAARNLPWHPMCLAQAIAVRRMLDRRGISSEVIFGVRKGVSGVEAHAWLISRGHVVVGDGELETYTEIHRFP